MTEIITSVLLSTYTAGCVLVLMLAMAATLGALAWGITECIFRSMRRIYGTVYVLEAIKHYKKIKPWKNNE